MRFSLFTVSVLLLLCIGIVGAQPPSSGSISLDGDGDYLLVPDDDYLDRPMSIDAWVRHDGTSGVCQTIVGKSWQWGYWLGICPGNVLRYTVNGVSLDSTIEVPPNEWTRVMMVRNYIPMLYINGVQAAVADSSFPQVTDNTRSLGIGADYDGQLEFSGELAQVMLWSSDVRQLGYFDEIMRDWEGNSNFRMNGYWAFAGNTEDATGRHTATVLGDVSFSAETPAFFPYEPIHIPVVDTAPTLDGACDADEYGEISFPIIYRVSRWLDNATVRLAATDTHLYICGTSLEVGDAPDHKFAAYIDSNSSGGITYTPDHFRLWTEQPLLVDGEWAYDLVGEQGNMDDWTPVSIDLSADVSGFLVAWTTEMRVSRADLGGLNGSFNMLFAHVEQLGDAPYENRVTWPMTALNDYDHPYSWTRFVIGEVIPTSVGLDNASVSDSYGGTPTAALFVAMVIATCLTVIRVRRNAGAV